MDSSPYLADNTKEPKVNHDIDIEIATINTTLERILDHHREFKNDFQVMNSMIVNITNLIHKEKEQRMENLSSIKDELHGRINKIMFSILGGGGFFLSGILTYVLIEGMKK